MPKGGTRAKDPDFFIYSQSSSPLPDNGMLPKYRDVDLALSEKIKMGMKPEKAQNEVSEELFLIWKRLMPHVELQDNSLRISKMKRLQEGRHKELRNAGFYKVGRRLNCAGKI